jgi:hypothetical protein
MGSHIKIIPIYISIQHMVLGVAETNRDTPETFQCVPLPLDVSVGRSDM